MRTPSDGTRDRARPPPLPDDLGREAPRRGGSARARRCHDLLLGDPPPRERRALRAGTPGRLALLIGVPSSLAHSVPAGGAVMAAVERAGQRSQAHSSTYMLDSVGGRAVSGEGVACYRRRPNGSGH